MNCLLFPNTVGIHIIFTDPCICSHSTGFVHIVPFVVNQMPAFTGHGAVGFKVIPFSADLTPGFADHRTAGIHVIPGAFYLLPSGQHIAGSVEKIVFSIDLFPAVFRVGAICMTVPPAFAVFLPGCFCSRRYNFSLREGITFSINPVDALIADTVQVEIVFSRGIFVPLIAEKSPT